MPVHTYKCKCGIKFDKIVSKNNMDSINCDGCGSSTKRILSAPATKFVSKGFRSTDIPDIDKVIGADAEKRWEALEDRSRRQKTVVREGAYAIAKDGGDYVPIDKATSVGLAKVQAYGDSVATPAPELPPIEKPA